MLINYAIPSLSLKVKVAVWLVVISFTCSQKYQQSEMQQMKTATTCFGKILFIFTTAIRQIKFERNKEISLKMSDTGYA